MVANQSPDPGGVARLSCVSALACMLLRKSWLGLVSKCLRYELRRALVAHRERRTGYVVLAAQQQAACLQQAKVLLVLQRAEATQRGATQDGAGEVARVITNAAMGLVNQKYYFVLALSTKSMKARSLPGICVRWG